MRAGARRGALALAVASITLLAGCVTTAPPVGPTDSATPSADSTSGAFEPLSWPSQVYQGDCAEIANGTELSALLGRELPEPRHQLTIPVIQSGGIDCLWDAADDGFSATPGGSLTLTVLPLVAVPGAREATSCASSPTGAGELGTCLFTMILDEVVFSGRVNAGIGSTVDDAEASLALLTEHFTSIAGDADVGELRPRTADAWPATTDCVELDERARIAELFGAAEMTPETNEYPTGPALVTDELATGHGWTLCTWQSYEQTTSGLVFLAATVYADGAWAAEELRRDGEPVTIEGADEAFVVTTPSAEGDQQLLWVTRGSNLLAVSTYWSTIDEAYPAVPVLLDALDALD